MRYYIFLLVIFLIQSTDAKDLGKHHETFEIKERNAIELLQEKAGIWWERGGEQAFKNQMNDAVEQLYAGIYLPRAQKTEIQKVDTIVQYPEDIKDDYGNIIYKAMTAYDVAEYVYLINKYIFIDGNDEQQVYWVKNRINNHKDNIVIILTSGNIAKLSEEIDYELFLDQKSQMIERFDIRELPAEIIQNSEGIWVQTYNIDEVI